MRPPNDQEAQLLTRRRELFSRFEAESVPALVDFGTALGASPPESMVAAPEAFLASVDAMLAGEDVSTLPPDERRWIESRLIYFVGQLFARRHRGRWLVQDDPDSRRFARFVVGAFGEGAPTQGCVDPAEVVRVYLEDPPGRRSLAALVAEVEAELARM